MIAVQAVIARKEHYNNIADRVSSLGSQWHGFPQYNVFFAGIIGIFLG